MPRAPVTTEARQGGSPRQRLWTAIRVRAKGGSFITMMVLDDAKVGGRTGVPYLRALAAAGHLEQVGPTEWRLVRDTGAEAPRVRADGSPVTQGLGREQMWRTIRLLRAEFDFRELAIAASTDVQPVSDADARFYVQHLARVGYLRRVRPDDRKRPARWRLARDTGPLAPKVCKAKVVWDPNTGAVALAEELEP